MKIIKLEDSQLKSKRFRIYLDNNKHYDFGLKTGETYIIKTKSKETITEEGITTVLKNNHTFKT